MSKLLSIALFLVMVSTTCLAKENRTFIPVLDDPVLAAEIDKSYDESVKLFEKMVNFFKTNKNAKSWKCSTANYSSRTWNEFEYRIKESAGKYAFADKFHSDIIIEVVRNY